MTLGSIKCEEDSLVDELRRRMKGIMNQEMYEDDTVFQRFLRARSHNIDAAENMLRNHLNWRKQNKVDNILTDYTPHPFMTSEYITISRLGFDQEGAPVTYVHFGGLDTRGVLNSVRRPEIHSYVTQHLETEVIVMKKQSAKLGKLVDKCAYIFNFENFSLTSATHKQTLETLVGLAKMYDAHFPERLKIAYFINASYFFTLAWAVIGPFLSPPTVQKIKIFGKSGWQDELQSNISPDVLPAFLGGNRTDPDGNPKCKTIIRFGGIVPETWFENRNKECSTRLPGAKKLLVNRMSKAEVELQVLYPGSNIEWEFNVKNRDIAFSLLYKESSNCKTEYKEVIPRQRIETLMSSESGLYLCEKSGIYVIEFDNSYSWMHNKEIYYVASVVNPRKQKSSVGTNHSST